jgi:hypothetical protein
MAWSKSKICTIVSIILLMVSLSFTSLYFDSSTKFNYELVTLIGFCCLMSSGISLLFSSGIDSKVFKRLVIILNWICVYGWFLFNR